MLSTGGLPYFTTSLPHPSLFHWLSHRADHNYSYVFIRERFLKVAANKVKIVCEGELQTLQLRRVTVCKATVLIIGNVNNWWRRTLVSFMYVVYWAKENYVCEFCVCLVILSLHCATFYRMLITTYKVTEHF